MKRPVSQVLRVAVIYRFDCTTLFAVHLEKIGHLLH